MLDQSLLTVIRSFIYQIIGYVLLFDRWFLLAVSNVSTRFVAFIVGSVLVLLQFLPRLLDTLLVDTS